MLSRFSPRATHTAAGRTLAPGTAGPAAPRGNLQHISSEQEAPSLGSPNIKNLSISFPSSQVL